MRRSLAQAFREGWRVLERGGPALEAVVAAVRILEDCPEFNAGRGSVLTAAGDVEMDAAVMDGAARKAGAVAIVRRVVHPVEAALAVMRETAHVLLAGDDAECFAAERGLELAEPDSFVTPLRREQLQRARRAAADGGTVGAVARDARGHLAAATSTGGMTGKLPGRVSDSSLVGAGFWADDTTCAVSATGTGESFIRCAFAHEIHALLCHARLDLASACERALTRVRADGGQGGCIAVDAAGDLALPFDTPAMPRAWNGADAAAHVAIRADDRERIG